MTNEFFQTLQQWQSDPCSHREVKISLGGSNERDQDMEYISIYDYDNAVYGERVKCEEDLNKDFKSKRIAQIREQLERLEGNFREAAV